MTEFEQAVIDKLESIEQALSNNTEQLQLVNQRLEMLGGLTNSTNTYMSYQTYILIIFLVVMIAFAFIIYMTDLNNK